MFSVVNAVILQPLGYPHPEQLRFLTTRFERQGGGQSSLSVPEYVELTEISQSFSVVGAFTIGEVNLAALDRPAPRHEGHGERRAARGARRPAGARPVVPP